ncbi:MAG: hypothetical protein RI947_886 [Candidatus Parcubacteria bacterium]
MRYRQAFPYLFILLCLLISTAVVQSAVGNSVSGTLVVRQGDRLVNGRFQALPPEIGLYDQSHAYHRLTVTSGSVGELMRMNGRHVTINIGTQSVTQPTLNVESIAASGISVQDLGSPMIGPQPWASILCSVPGSPAPKLLPPSFYSGMFRTAFPSIEDFFRDISKGKMFGFGPYVKGWYDLPHNLSYYMEGNPYPNLDRLLLDCAAVADADIKFTDFVGINLFFDVDFASSWGGMAELSLDGVTRLYRTTWIHQSEDPLNFVTHEDGHGYGLSHSCGEFDNCDEYSDYTTQMSGIALKCDIVRDPNYGCIPLLFSAFDQYQLGLLDPFVTTTEGYHEYNLQGLYDSGAQTRAILIRFSEDSFITIEARKLAGYDAKLITAGVILHEVDRTRYPFQGFINVAHNGDNLSKQAYMTKAGQIYTDPNNRFSVCLKSITSGVYRIGVGVGVDCNNPPPPTSTPTPTRTPTITPTMTPTPTRTPTPVEPTPTQGPSITPRLIYLPFVGK